jgi:hypothetical protein
MPARPRPPLTRVRARNCYLANQFATPGLGSIMGGRWLVGIGQVTVAVVGVVVAFVGFARECQDLIRMIHDEPPTGAPAARIMLLGTAIFALAWLWALVTSRSLRREAETNERIHLQTPG